VTLQPHHGTNEGHRIRTRRLDHSRAFEDVGVSENRVAGGAPRRQPIGTVSARVHELREAEKRCGRQITRHEIEHLELLRARVSARRSPRLVVEGDTFCREKSVIGRWRF
jgi:hypothetical protein